MPQDLYKLPQGWEWKELKAVARITTGNTPLKKNIEYYSNGTFPFVKPPDLGSEKPIYETAEYLSDVGFKKAKPIASNSILVCCIGSIGKIGIAGRELATNQQINAITFDSQVSFKWGYYFSLTLEKLMKSMANVAVVSIINKSTFSCIQIPLPPLPEQQRIVKKLDALFSRIDAATTRLNNILTHSKALFASALDDAFIPTGNINRLPEGWSLELLESVTNKITDGTHHSPKEQFQEEGKNRFKYVTSKNIKFTGLQLEDITYVSKNVHDEIYARCNPEYLDQLITKDGAMTGTCCLNTLHEPFSLLSSVAVLKLKKDRVAPHFLNYFLRSPAGQNLMLGDISGAAITRTNLKKLKTLQIPLPPLNEQHRIVEKLDALSARIQTLETTTCARLAHLATLKASLLSAAFHGEL